MSRLAGKTGDVYVATQLIEDCEDAWLAASGAIVCSLDTLDYKIGSGSAKLVTTDVGVTTLLATEIIASVDLTTYTQIMFWIKSSINQALGDCQLLLDDTAACESPIELLNIPALEANIWRLYKVVLATPESLGAIISVGLKQITDLADMTLRIDEIRAAKRIAGIKNWTLDQIAETQEGMGFDSGGHREPVVTVEAWSGSFDGYKDGAPLTIGSVIHLELRESATATQQYRGSAIITGLHVGTSAEGLVTYTYDFVGVGLLEIASS